MKDYPVFDAEVYPDRKKIRLIGVTCLAMTLFSIACMIWSLVYWDDYSTTRRYLFAPESTFDWGFAPWLFGWALTFVILFPLIFGLVRITLDFKRPVLAVNRKGIFLNHKLFKRVFLTWNEFRKIEKLPDGSLALHFQNPETVIGLQPRPARYFLKTTYVQKGLPFIIEPDLKYLAIIALAERYGTNTG